MSKHHEWLPGDDELIRQHYTKWPTKKLANALNRSERSVWNRARNLKLARSYGVASLEKREKKSQVEFPKLDRRYDPFGRPLAIFCVRNVTTHVAFEGDAVR